MALYFDLTRKNKPASSLPSVLLVLSLLALNRIALAQSDAVFHPDKAQRFSESKVQRSKLVNLIPDKISETPNYWCTWKTQAYTIENTVERGKTERWEKLDNLSQEHVFGKNGWANSMYPKVRNNLYLLFDDGWEVRLDSSKTGHDRRLMGTMVLAADKFPDCSGTPAERLKKLNQFCISAGWRGAALWIPAQASGETGKGSTLDSVQLYNYFRERFTWCKVAGIKYLKVDWGYRMRDAKFRAMLTSLAKEVYPELIVEHASGTPPLNDYGCPWCSNEFRQTGRFKTCEMGKTFHAATTIIPVSAVFRTYDTSEPFNITTTIDRLAAILKNYSGETKATSILNCEDAPYIGAALGCAIGLMSVPPTSGDINTEKARYDEAVRAVNWSKIAPAFGIGFGKNYVDTVILEDTHVFKPGESWINWLNGEEVMQAAPAIIARNMPLPRVSSKGDTPFVIASRNPNGAVSVATQERNSTEKGLYFPLADVSIEVGNGNYPIGIFGRYKSLELDFTKDISGIKVFAQDLASNAASDITKLVTITGKSMLLPGGLIDKIGLSAASLNDVSEPGMVIILKH